MDAEGRAAAPVALFGVIEMVAPRFTWPPEALLIEKSTGVWVGDGDTLGDWAGDGELGEEAGVGAQSVAFRELSGDWVLRYEGVTVIVCLA